MVSLAQAIAIFLGGSKRITFLFRDDFTTGDAAPLASPRTTEPSGHTATVTDVEGIMSISGGLLNVPAQGTPLLGDEGIVYPAITRADGVAVIHQINMTTSSTAYLLSLARNAAPTPGGFSQLEHGIILAGSGAINLASQLAASVSGITTISAATDYYFAIVLRTTGAFVLLWDGAWRLLWVFPSGTTATLYLNFSNFGGAWTMDTIRAANLPADGYGIWQNDGIAIAKKTSPAPDTTAVAGADALAYVTWTPTAGETLDIMVRRTDDTTTWSIVCAEATAVSNPNTIKLIERNAGDTERGTAAQTFTAGLTYRIGVRHFATTIAASVDVTAKIAYTSATFNQAVTGSKLSGYTNGDVTIWNIWPRTLTGQAKNALDAVVAG